MNWHILKSFAGQLLSSMADASLSTVVLAASVAMLILFLRRNSAAQHALWTLVMMGMPALLLLRPVIPAARLHLPQPISLATVTTGPVFSVPMNSANVPVALPTARTRPLAVRLGWPEYAALTYLSVMMLLAVRLLLGLFLSRRLLRGSRSIASELWQHFDTVMAAGGEVQLEESTRLRAPVTTGAWRMRIIFPVDWRAWPAEKLQAVLAHELAHARRRDPLIALVAAFNKCVFWFHPLAWWLERRLAVLAEHAADDAAIAASHDAPSYARIVLEVASGLQEQNRRLIWHDIAINSTALTGPLIAQRIRRIMDQRSRNYAGKLGRRARVMLLSGAVLLVWLSTIVDFQSVARAQEKQISGGGGGGFLVLTGPRNQGAQTQGGSDLTADENLASFLGDGVQTDSNPFTAQQAAEMERQLAVNPEDEETRAKLLRHYWQTNLDDKRISLILWLIDNHPESTLHGRQTAHIFRNGFHGNAAAFDDAKSRWLAQVNQHPEDAAILGNAGRALNESNLSEGIALMKRAQTLDPAHRTPPLAWLYSMLLMNSVSRPEPGDPEVAQIRGDLQVSNDVLLVGSVARYVARMSVPTPSGKSRLKVIAAELIKHAETLDPQNREWPALLEGVQGLRDISEQPPISIEPHLMHVSKNMAAGALLESETPDYPPQAQAIHLRGTVLLQVRINKDGYVTEAKAVSGHPLLVQPAMEAVKRYVYKPFMLDGNAVEAQTVVEVMFRE